MRLLLIYTFLFVGTICFGQKPVASISKRKILIGDTATIHYSLKTTSARKPQFSPHNNAIESYSINKDGSISIQKSNAVESLEPFKDTLFNLGNYNVWVGTYTITIMDSGSYLIKGPKILVGDSTLYFPELTITSNFVDAIPGKEIYDIKEQFAKIPDDSMIKKIKDYSWLILVVLLIVAGIYFYLRKRKDKTEFTADGNEISLKKRTLLAIDSLEESRLWEKNQLKEHYVQLSFILRSYLSDRFEVYLLERTTKDTLLLLKQKGISENDLISIKRILEESDMVKFAKFSPIEQDIMKASTLVRQVIYQTSPIDENFAD